MPIGFMGISISLHYLPDQITNELLDAVSSYIMSESLVKFHSDGLNCGSPLVRRVFHLFDYLWLVKKSPEPFSPYMSNISKGANLILYLHKPLPRDFSGLSS